LPGIAVDDDQLAQRQVVRPQPPHGFGADVGASADATFKTSGTKGLTLDGSTSFNPHLSVYQITDSGALLQANWGGVAYLPDGELNAK